MCEIPRHLSLSQILEELHHGPQSQPKRVKSQMIIRDFQFLDFRKYVKKLSIERFTFCCDFIPEDGKRRIVLGFVNPTFRIK